MSIKSEQLSAVREAGGVGQQQMKLLHAVKRFPGFTRSELAQQTGIRLSSVCARINELERIGLVKTDGRKRCSLTGRVVSTVRPTSDGLTIAAA